MTEAKLNQELIEDLVVRWRERTHDQEETAVTVPIKVLQGEAIDLAQLLDRHFESVAGKSGMLPALSSIIATGQMSPTLASEIRELQLAVGAVQNDYEILVERANDQPIVRVEEILRELKAALSFVLEDGEHPDGEQQLDQLRDLYGEERSHDGLARAVESYANLARDYSAEISKIDGFGPALFDEAVQVAAALRQRSADRLAGELMSEQREILGLRNRLLSALNERMLRARRAFRFVFRDYPEIASKAGSDYQRERRRNQRNKANSTVPSSGVQGEAGLGSEPTMEIASVTRA